MTRIPFICCALLIILGGCSNKTKEKIGFASSGPDEYMVIRGKGLEIPPQLNVLPEPTTSTAIPQYNSSNRKLDSAEQALMSDIDSNIAE